MKRAFCAVVVVVSVLVLQAKTRADFEEIEMTWTDVQDGIVGSDLLVIGNVTSPTGETEGGTIVLKTNPGFTHEQTNSDTIGEGGDFGLACGFTGGTPFPFGLVAFDENDDYDFFQSVAGD
jgi:hypothetical protein